VNISQSGVDKAARKVGSHLCSDLTFNIVNIFILVVLFSCLQLLGAMGSEEMEGVTGMGNEGTGGVTAVVDPLEPPGLSENDTLEW